MIQSHIGAKLRSGNPYCRGTLLTVDLLLQTSLDRLLLRMKTLFTFMVEESVIWENMEQHTLKNINNCLNTNIYSYLETSGGQSSNQYLNALHFLNTRAN